MYELKKLDDVNKHDQIMHAVGLGMELVMMLVSMGLLIHCIVVGNPDNRAGSMLLAMVTYALPFLVEVIFKRRFPFVLHVIFVIHITVAVLLGSALGFNHSIEPYDEIMHFLFGYMASFYIFYILLAWRDFASQKTYFSMLIIFMMSLGVATLWEITEFATDILLGQNALGYPLPEVLAEGQAMGLSGIGLAVHCLSNGVMVWDTLTDMCLHLGGTTLFVIQFGIESKVDRRLMLTRVRDEYQRNKNAFYVTSAECITENETSALL